MWYLDCIQKNFEFGYSPLILCKFYRRIDFFVYNPLKGCCFG